MINYDFTWVTRIAGRDNSINGNRLKPFPGKVPTRVYIRIVSRDNAWKKTVHFSYNGKRDNAPFRRAKRLLIALKATNLEVYSEVWEYLPRGIIYTGNLYYGNYFPEYAAFYLNVYPMSRAQTAVQTVTSMTVVSFKGRMFYLPSSEIPVLGDVDGWNALRNRMAERVRLVRG